MPFNGNSLFTPYVPGNPVISGTTIDSTAFNSTVSDIALGLSDLSVNVTELRANLANGTGFGTTGIRAVKFVSDSYDTFQPNIYGGASLGRWFQNFGAGKYFEFVDSVNLLGYVVDGLYRWQIQNDRLSIWNSRVNEIDAGFTTRLNSATDLIQGSVYNDIQNELGFNKFRTRLFIKPDGSSEWRLQTSPVGTARNVEVLDDAIRVVSGAAGKARVIVGNAVDDNVSTLQSKTLSLTEQPGIALNRGGFPTQTLNSVTTAALLKYGSTERNVGFSYNSTTGQITVLSSGYYLLAADVSVNLGNANGAMTVVFEVYKNSAYSNTIAYHDVFLPISSMLLASSKVYFFNANDIITVNIAGFGSWGSASIIATSRNFLLQKLA